MAGKEKTPNENTKTEKKENKNKKKKGGGGLLILLLLIILLLLLLGWGIGLGGFGGMLPGGIGMMPATQKQPEQQVQEEAPTPVEETDAADKSRVDEEGTSHVIVVGENGITFDGEAVTTDALTEMVSGLTEGTEVVLKDEHAVVGDYSAVKAILDAANIVYTEEK